MTPTENEDAPNAATGPPCDDAAAAPVVVERHIDASTNSDSDGDGDAEGARVVRRPTAFQPAHALRFGLEVIARDASGAVTSALCLFCKHFGREPKPGAKRRATTNFKYFKGSFRTDQYVQHHRLQHPVKWAAYEASTQKEKQVFFPRHVIPTHKEASTSAAATKRQRKQNDTQRQQGSALDSRADDCRLRHGGDDRHVRDPCDDRIAVSD
ncbi:hypothetical protein PINS_up004952 [Pythium insidiosum]|nr:hypothetical protein PINS_up004952 [Pythium insidiosum]